MTEAPKMLDAGHIDAVTGEVNALSAARIGDLRERYRLLFRRDPPKAFGPDLLRRSIAYRLQENAFGGLSPDVQSVLDQVVQQVRKSPAGPIKLPRRIMPGAVLVRQWKGASHRVTVLPNGYSYNDQQHKSLSEIARAITGTRWNGPRFFGLRQESGAAPDER